MLRPAPLTTASAAPNCTDQFCNAIPARNPTRSQSLTRCAVKTRATSRCRLPAREARHPLGENPPFRWLRMGPEPDTDRACTGHQNPDQSLISHETALTSYALAPTAKVTGNGLSTYPRQRGMVSRWRTMRTRTPRLAWQQHTSLTLVTPWTRHPRRPARSRMPLLRRQLITGPAIGPGGSSTPPSTLRAGAYADG